MSSPKQKKVHYERGTKGEKTHKHRSSRDSGVGSSSASDRASLGTSPNDSPFQYIGEQRHSLSAVQEALDAAKDQIRQLEASNHKLNLLLSESNKENRLLKREKGSLLEKVDDLLDLLEEEKKRNEKMRRESSPRSSTSSRNSPPRIEPPRHRERRDHADERSQISHTSDRRSSFYERPPPAPQAPPNPFTPLSSRTPAATYPPPGPITYPPTTLSYAPTPVFAHSQPPVPTSRNFVDEKGRYHLTPL